MPKTVGRYQILDRVAVGGMAELFKAQLTGQHGFEKLVAIKKILPHLANDRTFVEMFVDEARITAQLDHRNIVAVFELGTDADTPYIAMQYVDGLDVLGLLRECARTQIRLPPDLAALIARDVLDALDYAHRARDNNGRPLEVIHRDVSPGNVLLSWRGDIKLTDFGIARAVERQHKTEAGTLKGKYGYMSPEQVSGAEIDARSDLFSVGILLAEMIMARRLFAAPNDLDILLAVRDARLDRLHKYSNEFPDGLRALVIRALQRRPELRWSSAAAFRDDLDLWLRQNTSTTHRDLAEFMAAVAGAPTADIYEEIEGIPDGESDAGLSGPATRMSMAKAEADVRAARAQFISGSAAVVAGKSTTGRPDSTEGTPDVEIADESSSSYMIVDDADVLADPDDNEVLNPVEPEKADLAEVSVLRLIHEIAKQRRSGLITLDNGAGVVKQVFFMEGQPQFIHSNVASERFGEFLVAQGVLNNPALQRALSVIHRFDGRLADTLVALDLITPLDAYRLFAKQVAAKLTSAFNWERGGAAFVPGFRNPWKARPLHLDSFRILGSGAGLLDRAFIEAWEARNQDRFILSDQASHTELEVFGLGDALKRVHALLDGQSKLKTLLAKVRSPEARLNLARLMYLLEQTDYASMQ